MSVDPAISSVDDRAAKVLGQELAQSITELSGSLPPGVLLDRVAQRLVHLLPLSEVAFYLASTSSGTERAADTRVRETAHCLSSSATTNTIQTRSMRAAALLAMRRHSIYLREQREERGPHDAGRIAAFTLAVPLGSPTIHAVLVVRGAHEYAHDVRSALTQVLGELQVAARLAALAQDNERNDLRREQLRAIFATSSEALIGVDRAYHITEANPAAAKLLEWDSELPIGKHCAEVLTCRDKHGHVLCHTTKCPLTQAFTTLNTSSQPVGSTYREVSWQTHHGNQKEVSASFAPVQAPDGRQGIIVAHDLTPMNADDRTRAHFISMVSHELRTPTNSINGFLDIVTEGHVGPLNPRQTEFLNYARSSTQQLMTLVEDTLFISRADAGRFKLRFDTVVVPDLIEQTVKNFRAAAEHANVELSIKLPEALPTLYADEVRLQQVLSNLIQNAIKFTPPEGKVTVQVSLWQHDMVFDICDTGEGIPLDKQLRVFGRFYQIPSSTQAKSGGYGLGLAIAQLIVEQHGGRIWVTSEPPNGSTFTFTIPLSEEHAPDPTLDSQE